MKLRLIIDYEENSIPYKNMDLQEILQVANEELDDNFYDVVHRALKHVRGAHIDLCSESTEQSPLTEEEMAILSEDED